MPVNGTKTSLTFTSKGDYSNIRMYIYKDKVDVGSYVIFKNFQIEEGSTATEYVPYVEPITENIYLDAPLRKIGDCESCADYIDFETGKFVRNDKEKVLNGSEDFVLLDVGTNIARVYTILNDKANDVDMGLCSHFKKVESTKDIPTSCDFPKTYFRVNVSELEISSVSGWKEYLKNNYNNGMPIEIMYSLATPKFETVELPDINTGYYKNFKINTSLAPSEIVIK